ncbi:glutamate 5-kinase [Sphingomonas sp.]|uniref:glutamate 5-kinase n=1 Tax=Sphingomonas sp. TaxID=28214 RepID=UPI003B001B0E
MTRAALFSPPSCPVLVVKIGSSLLVAPDGRVRRDWLAGIVADVAARRAAGQRIILVSSGAIALGARRLGLPGGGRASLEDAQAAAATGQIALSQTWAELLGERGITAAQMLLTLDDLEDRRRYLNASATLARLLALGVVPVVNENDSVATEEIRFGDNDRLAARVALAAGAGGVVLLSDVDGLYTADPARDPSATLVADATLDAATLAMADGASRSGMGSGGMAAKLAAARIAHEGGAHLAIVGGAGDRPLSAFADTARGTVFAASARRGARKAWLAGRLTARGRILIDEGAADALGRGASLLPAGARAAEGRFARGDVVDIVGADGRIVARGLAEYDGEEARRIAGRRSTDLADLLGYAPRAALVHRDHMVML